MDALIRQLGDAFEQPATEAIKAQRSCGKTLQVIRRIGERIEADSKELGRLKETNDTLIALEELEHDFHTLDHTLAWYLACQKKVLPVLMEHAANLRSLVQARWGNTRICVRRSWKWSSLAIEKNDQSVQEQLKAMIIGGFFGVLTVKGALAIATVTFAAVAVPIGFAFTAAGCGIFAKSKLDADQNESQYIRQLEALEIERSNMKSFPDSIKNATEKRTRATESSRGHINSLIGFLRDVPLLPTLG